MKRAKAACLPPALRDELARAHGVLLHHLPRSKIRALLKRYQRNRARYIASVGIRIAGRNATPTGEPVPVRFLDAVARLDDAQDLRRRFRAGDVDHFTSPAIEAAAQSKRGSEPRPGRKPKVCYAKLVKACVKAGYGKATRGEKKRIVENVAEEQGVKPRTVRTALAKMGLTKQGRGNLTG